MESRSQLQGEVDSSGALTAHLLHGIAESRRKSILGM